MFVKKQLYTGFGIAGLCLLAWALAGAVGLRRAPEGLMYHGKSVENWALRLSTLDTKSRGEAIDALKAMGPSAVPGLIRLLHAKDSFFRNQIWAVVPRLSAPFQKVVVTRVRPPNATASRIASARSLAIIGPEAEAAVLMGTLAAAYAETGRFADAVRMAERARDKARTDKQEAAARRNEEVLELYRADKPFREVK